MQVAKTGVEQAMSREISQPECDVCGINLGPEVERCPQRQAGGSCPYKAQNEKFESSYEFSTLEGIGLVVAIGLAVVLIGSLFWLWIADVIDGVVAVTVTVIVLVSGFLTYLFSRYVTLINRKTGATWRSIIVLGIPMKTQYFANSRPVKLPVPSTGLPELPFSIAEFETDTYLRFSMDNAVGTTYAAICGLLYRDCLRIVRYEGFSALFGRRLKRSKQPVFLLRAGNGEAVSSQDGKLEYCIFSAVKDAPFPITIYEAIRALYDSDERKPARSLIKLVVNDATRRLHVNSSYQGFMNSWGRFKIVPTNREQFEKQRSAARQMIHDASRNGLEELRPEIKRAIKSRVYNDV